MIWARTTDSPTRFTRIWISLAVLLCFFPPQGFLCPSYAAFEYSVRVSEGHDEKATIALLKAASGAPADEAKRLIGQGADVNAFDPAPGYDQLTPLMYAARDNPDPEALRALIAAGADIGAKSRRMKRTPLAYAAGFNPSSEVLCVLIGAGAEIDARSKLLSYDYQMGNDEWTPLMLSALHGGNHEVLRALVDAGADVEAKDHNGKTALDYATDNKALEGSNALETIRDKTKQMTD